MSVLDKQEGGSHYDFPIQPIEYIVKNEMGYREGNVVKYVTRHQLKNGAEDIKKAIHYLEMILEEYNAQEQKGDEAEECHHMQDCPRWGEIHHPWYLVRKGYEGTDPIGGTDREDYLKALMSRGRGDWT